MSQLARRYGLSRSTLLYYDRIGVLECATRAPSGYRRYSLADARRLERIRTYRKAGLSIESIRRLLSAKDDGVAAALATRLEALNQEIIRLREQQRFIVGLLGQRDRLERVAFMSREKFVSLLARSGLTAADMSRWHSAFERTSPDEHQRFLEFLCIPDPEIRRIWHLSARERPGDRRRRRRRR